MKTMEKRMNRKLITLVLIASLSMSAWSCSSKKSSSEASPETSTAQEAATAELLKLGESYTLSDGNFKISVPEGMKQLEENSMYEYTFQLGDDQDSLIGLSSVSNMHQTATGFGEGILVDHESAGFTDIKGSPYSLNGIPAYKITATDSTTGKDMDYRMDLFQYGNGDLICVNAVAPKGTLADYASEFDTVISSVEYLGTPLKAEPENVDNARFSLTVPENLFIRDASDDENVYIGYNLNNTTDEYICRLELTVMDDMTPTEASDTLFGQWEKNERSSERSRDNCQFMGYDALHIKQVISLTETKVDSESYHFEAGGTTYWISITSAQPLTEQFKKDIQPVLDSFSFK